MRGRAGRIAALMLVVVSLAAILSSVVTAHLPIVSISWGARHTEVPITVGLMAIGGLLLVRRSDNAVSWLLGAAGLAGGLQLLLFNYGVAAAAWGWPAGATASVLGDMLWPAIVISLFWSLMRFPNGTPPRVLGRAGDAVAALAIVVVGMGELLVGGAVGYGLFDHPWPMIAEGSATAEVVEALALLLLVTIAGAVINLVVRMRRATGVELQQLRWVRAAVIMALLANATVVAMVLARSGSVQPPVASGRWTAILTTVSMLSFAGVVVAIGIAILRYRLYDLDRLVSRTLLYATLTAVTIGVYAGMVLSLSAAFRAAAATERSSVVVAVSTLVAAALVSPLRTRLQDIIDRRLYRARFDAQRAASRFGAALRDVAAVDEIADEMRRVLGRTLQPASVGIWLARGEDADRPGRQDAP